MALEKYLSSDKCEDQRESVHCEFSLGTIEWSEVLKLKLGQFAKWKTPFNCYSTSCWRRKYVPNTVKISKTNRLKSKSVILYDFAHGTRQIANISVLFRNLLSNSVFCVCVVRSGIFISFNWLKHHIVLFLSKCNAIRSKGHFFA